MALATMQQQRFAALPTRGSRTVMAVRCQAAAGESKVAPKVDVKVVALVAGALLARQAVVPEQALAARSGGRASSTAGFAARRAAGPGAFSARSSAVNK